MPPKKVCTDRQLKKNETREKPGICFKKGIKAGFVAGINRARVFRRGVKHAEPIRVGLALRKLQKPLNEHNLDTLRAVARNVGNPYKQNTVATIAGLRVKGINRAGILHGRGKCSA